MVVNVETLFEQANALSESDREELANRLYDTLPPLPELPVVWESEGEAEAAWQAELNHRLVGVANGTAELLPGEQVFSELREALRHRHLSVCKET